MPATFQLTPPAAAETEDPFSAMRDAVGVVNAAYDAAYAVYNTTVQQIADKYGVQIATGHMSDFWQVKRPRAKRWMQELHHDEHPALEELRKLDEIAGAVRISPGNMMMFHPAKGLSVSRLRVIDWLRRNKGGDWKYVGRGRWQCLDGKRSVSRVAMDIQQEDGPVGYYLYGGDSPGWIYFT